MVFARRHHYSTVRVLTSNITLLKLCLMQHSCSSMYIILKHFFRNWFTAEKETGRWPPLTWSQRKLPTSSPVRVQECWVITAASLEVTTLPKWAKDCSATSCLVAIVCLSEFFPLNSQHQLFLSSSLAAGFQRLCVPAFFRFFLKSTELIAWMHYSPIREEPCANKNQWSAQFPRPSRKEVRLLGFSRRFFPHARVNRVIHPIIFFRVAFSIHSSVRKMISR